MSKEDHQGDELLLVTLRQSRISKIEAALAAEESKHNGNCTVERALAN